MNQQTRQQATHTAEASNAGAPAEGENLDATRANIERLFARAAENFDNLRTGDSREFIERSRQTGGQ